MIRPGGDGTKAPPAVDQPKVKAIRLHARIEELDLERAVGDAPRLADQLMQPLLAHHALALLVDITAMRRARRLSIEQARESARTFLAPPVP